MLSIEQIATLVRDDFENYYDGDLSELDNTCHVMTKELCEKLIKCGYKAERVGGMYHGADDDYYPNKMYWESEDEEDYLKGFNHWWVLVENNIIDICCDQFHPSDRESYRIVVTDANDSNYEYQHGTLILISNAL